MKLFLKVTGTIFVGIMVVFCGIVLVGSCAAILDSTRKAEHISALIAAIASVGGLITGTHLVIYLYTESFE